MKPPDWPQDEANLDVPGGARPADKADLTEISVTAKQFWGYPDEWMAAWHKDLTFTEEMIDQQHVAVAEVAGAAVGTYALVDSAGIWHLEHF